MIENLKKFEEKWEFKWKGHNYREGVSGEPFVLSGNLFNYCYSTYKKKLKQ